MAVSKVVLGDETLIDLTGDSVSSENLLQGETAHGANGEEVIGGVVVTPMYTGTKSAIEEAIALGQITEDAVVNITDDEETSSFQAQINEINSSLTLDYSQSSLENETINTFLQKVLVKLFPRITITIKIKMYGDSGSYNGEISITNGDTIVSKVCYRNTVTIGLDGVTVSMTMPNATSGGSVTITATGTYNIFINKNEIGATIPQSFANECTISGWSSDGEAIIGI